MEGRGLKQLVEGGTVVEEVRPALIFVQGVSHWPVGAEPFGELLGQYVVDLGGVAFHVSVEIAYLVHVERDLLFTYECRDETFVLTLLPGPLSVEIGCLHLTALLLSLAAMHGLAHQHDLFVDLYHRGCCC